MSTIVIAGESIKWGKSSFDAIPFCAKPKDRKYTWEYQCEQHPYFMGESHDPAELVNHMDSSSKHRIFIWCSEHGPEGGTNHEAKGAKQ